ncbi:MRG/MORF4L-binding protein-like [Antedon mediterranea]|uniref:MRG/MORF4L-binding protein-like n=1 Tax=Antedon mediterranea TaxID=105859 RepID=UPI003AF921E6
MAIIGEEPLNWTVDMEVNLFHAMRGHKPVGVNKNFHMLCIHEKLTQMTGKKLTSQQIWKHLSTMYDLAALHESEIVPFPNKEKDFDLPQSDFGYLMRAKDETSTILTNDEGSVKSPSRPPSAIPPGLGGEKDTPKRGKRTRNNAASPNDPVVVKRRR